MTSHKSAMRAELGCYCPSAFIIVTWQRVMRVQWGYPAGQHAFLVRRIECAKKGMKGLLPEMSAADKPPKQAVNGST
jgi:hypothetical protein